MIPLDLTGRTVVVTGATRGLGLAIAMAFAEAGALVVITHRWGSVPEDEVVAAFAARGLTAPSIVESDAGDPADTRALMRHVAALGLPLHAVVSNVSMAKVVRDLGDLKKRSLDLSLQYSAWPVVDLAQAADEVLGALPRYLIAISSDGTHLCHEGYDLVGASKSVVETLCRYLAVRLKPRGTRVNVVRPGALDTQGVEETFGAETVAAVRARVGDVWTAPAGVARAVLGLTSGLFDAVTGQVLVVDEGWSLVSPLSFVTGRDAPFAFPSAGGDGADGTETKGGESKNLQPDRTNRPNRQEPDA